MSKPAEKRRVLDEAVAAMPFKVSKEWCQDNLDLLKRLTENPKLKAGTVMTTVRKLGKTRV